MLWQPQFSLGSQRTGTRCSRRRCKPELAHVPTGQPDWPPAAPVRRHQMAWRCGLGTGKQDRFRSSASPGQMPPPPPPMRSMRTELDRAFREPAETDLSLLPSDEADSRIVKRPRMGFFAQRALETVITNRLVAGLDATLLENVPRRNHSPGVLADHKSFVLDSHVRPQNGASHKTRRLPFARPPEAHARPRVKPADHCL